MNAQTPIEDSRIEWAQAIHPKPLRPMETPSQPEITPISAAASMQDAADFIATTVHDLNTPLNVASGFSLALLQGKAGPLSDMQKDILATIVASLKQAQVLVQDLLCFGQLRNGGIAIEYTPVDLRTIVRETVAQLRVVAEAAGVQLVEQALYGPPCIVSGSRLRLEQCLHNIIGNAIRFSNKGGAVSVSLGIGVGYEVIVEDHGIGIAPEHHSLIFQHRYQVTDDVGRATKGNGLGLSITKNLIEAHGGRIWVVSAPGEGSRFCISLPRPEMEAAALAS